MDQNNKTLNDKLTVVLKLLEESNQEYRTVEKNIRNQELRSVILELIDDGTKYSNQLSYFINPIEKKKKNGLESALSIDKLRICSEKKTSGDNLLEKFNQSECTFEIAYRQVLNSWFEQEELREMMVLQLNGIKCSFLKLKIKCLVLKKEWSPCFLYET